MKADSVNISGNLKIVAHKANGEKVSYEMKNLVVANGKTYLASRATSTPQTLMSHMAFGSGATVPASINSTLETETGRVVLASLTSNANVIIHTATLGAGISTGTISEAGLLNAAKAGVMLARTTFDPIVKEADDVFTIEWQIVIG